MAALRLRVITWSIYFDVRKIQSAYSSSSDIGSGAISHLFCDCEPANCFGSLALFRCSDMEMRTAPRLAILVAMVMVVMVAESWACRPMKLKFILGEVENSNPIKMENGWFQSLPKGTPVPPSGPSQCKNYKPPTGSKGGSCPVNEINAAGIHRYPVLTNGSVGIVRGSDTSDQSFNPSIKRSSSQK